VTEELLYAGAEGQARAVASGELSATELTEAVLERISTVDPLLNAFTVVLADQARAEAAARDEALARGDQVGPLHGVPVAVKEELDVAGTVTTYGGAGNRTPAREDGHLTRRLRKAGAVIVGRTNMPELGAYPFTESARFGVTRNPWAPDRSPGGSSGGTAAAVAAGMVAVGMGGDGGGSIRIPSAACGLFGLKPTRGRVSHSPHPHLWEGLGTAGPLTRSVVDSALVYDVIRGNLPGDRFTAPEPASSFLHAARLTTASSQRKLRVGWSTRPVTKGVRPDPLHVQAVEETATLLEGLGHDVREVDPRYPDPTAAFVPQYFAGVRGGVARLEDPAAAEPRTRQLVRLGAWARPGLVERAVRRGERLGDAVDERVFGQVDVLLTPATASRPPVAPVLGRSSAPMASLRAMPMIAYAALWNVTGHPAASVPSGFADDGMPLAVQLVGRRGDETTLLALSAQMESVRPWADRRPDLGV
jgi:amidase